MVDRAVYHELDNADTRDINQLRQTKLYSRREIISRPGMEEHLEFDEWLDEIADRYLPKSLRSKGFSRLESVFAWPHNPNESSRVIELNVDSNKCLILPYDVYVSAFGEGMVEGIFAKRYWQEAVPLEEFLAKFEYKLWAESKHYAWQDERGFAYTQPEVIFPQEAIKEFKKILPPSKS